jgi:hypothetical protein
MTSRSGASAANDVSKRTWSLPLPVQPWATASAPASRAAATTFSAMRGRASEDTSGYRPSYSALACSAGQQNRVTYSSRASATSSSAPAAAARARTASWSMGWPTSTRTARTS